MCVSIYSLLAVVVSCSQHWAWICWGFNITLRKLSSSICWHLRGCGAGLVWGCHITLINLSLPFVSAELIFLDNFIWQRFYLSFVTLKKMDSKNRGQHQEPLSAGLISSMMPFGWCAVCCVCVCVCMSVWPPVWANTPLCCLPVSASR